MEFLELVETMKAEEASRSRLIGDLAAEGYRDCRSLRAKPDYNLRLSEAMAVLERARGSRWGMLRFEEAMQTGDFPLLMGDVLDRQLLGEYADAMYTSVARRSMVPDFRTVKRFAVDGAEGVLPTVVQSAQYQPQVLTETSYSYAVGKYGRLLSFSWEAFVNDDLGALGPSAPARLGRAARRSEAKFETQLYTNTTGPHSSLFTSGNKNIVNISNGASADNPALTNISALQDAYAVLRKQKDADGEPIMVEGAILVVGATLEKAAQNLLNATQIIVGADTGAQRTLSNNWVAGKLRLVVNPYINIVATTNGGTTWFLFAEPSSGRPAIEMGFLRGNEAPALFQKQGNQVRLGGASSPLDGSFENDSIEYKIRHVFGGARLDGKGAVSSNGSGS